MKSPSRLHTHAASSLLEELLRELLQADPQEIDRSYSFGRDASELWSRIDALCEASVQGRREAEVTVHRCLALLYDRALRIPRLDEWRGYGSAVVQAMQARFEQCVLSSLRARVRIPVEEPPRDAREFVRYLKDIVREHPSDDHAFYAEHMRHHADPTDLQHYFVQELSVDGRFDDLVALMQIGTTGAAKLELASNYWDEMGCGDAEAVHTDLFGRVIDALDISEGDIERSRTHESRVCGNVSVLLAARREHFYRAAGYLGITEYMVPPRMADVLRAWKRNGLEPSAVEYHRVHLPIDARHAHGWFTNVVEPAVAANPDVRFHVLEGALWRLATSGWYLDALMAHAQRRQETKQ